MFYLLWVRFSNARRRAASRNFQCNTDGFSENADNSKNSRTKDSRDPGRRKFPKPNCFMFCSRRRCNCCCLSRSFFSFVAASLFCFTYCSVLLVLTLPLIRALPPELQVFTGILSRISELIGAVTWDSTNYNENNSDLGSVLTGAIEFLLKPIMGTIELMAWEMVRLDCFLCS